MQLIFRAGKWIKIPKRTLLPYTLFDSILPGFLFMCLIGEPFKNLI